MQLKYIQSQSFLEQKINFFITNFKVHIDAAISGVKRIDPTEIINLENKARMLIRKLQNIPGTENLRQQLLTLLQESSAIEAKEDLRRNPGIWSGD